jgi:hypothetical protein
MARESRTATRMLSPPQRRVVFQLQVQHVNLATLTESKLGEISSVEENDDDKSKKKKDYDHTGAKKGDNVDATPAAQPQDVKH